jgi:hypothetical protein
MIQLFNSKRKVSAAYQNIEEVCDHFRRLEHLKPVYEESPNDSGRWDFAYWPHKRLSALHEHLKDTHFTQIEREAYESECDFIEIYDGRSEWADQYVVTPGLDIKSLMRKWCFDYAHNHGYTVLEVFFGDLSDVSSSAAHPKCRGLNCGGYRETLKEGVARWGRLTF